MGESLLLSADVLQAVDEEDGPAALTYTLLTTPVFGVLELTEVELTTGQTFTQQDINSGRLRYLHAGESVEPDSFAFALTDGVDSGRIPMHGEFLLEIMPSLPDHHDER